MATIDLGDGRYLAGEPETDLRDGYHWCEWCDGDGLDYDSDGSLGTCPECMGVGQVKDEP